MIKTRGWTAGRTYLMAIMICIMLWLSAGLLVRCALAQEPPEPAGPEELEYSLDATKDVQILLQGEVDWKNATGVTVVGMVNIPAADQTHIRAVWAGEPHDWYIPIADGTDRCVKIRLDDNAFNNVFLYRLRACIREVEADGSLSGASAVSVRSWYVIRLPGVLRPFFGG